MPDGLLFAYLINCTLKTNNKFRPRFSFMESFSFNILAECIENHFEHVGKRNVTEFADQAGVSRSTIYSILNREDINLSIEKIMQILDVAGYTMIVARKFK